MFANAVQGIIFFIIARYFENIKSLDSDAVACGYVTFDQCLQL